jgi:hypothetical protein
MGRALHWQDRRMLQPPHNWTALARCPSFVETEAFCQQNWGVLSNETALDSLLSASYLCYKKKYVMMRARRTT